MTHSSTRELTSSRAPAAITAIIAVWAFSPELRRLIDWKIGFNAISIVSILPYLVLLPAVAIVLYGRRLSRIDFRLLAAAFVWIGGFTFALWIGFANGNMVPAVYSYVLFVMPVAFGLWVATVRAPEDVLRNRISSALLWIATVLSFYAAVQFAILPAWDSSWMRNANITSIGTPIPFGFRVFSTLNAPAPFADFLVCALLLNLPRLKSPRPLLLFQFALSLGALALTQVRADWIALVLGIACYLLFTPQRMRTLTVLGGVLLAFGSVGAVAPLALGDTQIGTTISDRLGTLTNLSGDVSYNERAQYLAGPLTWALQDPVGSGLGVLGTAAKLSDTARTRDFDNGYIARLTEMGWFGSACYFGTIAFAFGFALWRRARALRAGDPDSAAFAAATAALGLALIALDTSSDHHNALSGLFFWLSLALVARTPAEA